MAVDWKDRASKLVVEKSYPAHPYLMDEDIAFALEAAFNEGAASRDTEIAELERDLKALDDEYMDYARRMSIA